MIGVQCFQPALLEYWFPQYPKPAAEQMVERGVYRYMPRFYLLELIILFWDFMLISNIHATLAGYTRDKPVQCGYPVRAALFHMYLTF